MWSPAKNQKITEKEMIGRRFFGEAIYNSSSTAKGLDGTLRLDHFYESRAGTNLSVDRLGLNKPDEDVQKIIGQLSEKHGQSVKKNFAGWGVFQAGHVIANPHNYSIEPTPLPENKHHADLQIAELNKIERNRVAFTLAQLSQFHPYCLKQPSENISAMVKIWNKFRDWVKVHL